MKNILFLWCMLLLGMYLHAQNKITGYEYWLDTDYSAKVQSSVTAASTLQIQQAIPCENLNAGLHSFSIRFKDENGQWSSVSSQIFKKIDLTPIDIAPIVAYEYWLDNDYGNRQTIPVTPATSIHVMQSIPFDELASGLHSFSIRFKDENGQWSSVSSQIFKKIDLTPIDIAPIVAYEYWLDNDYGNRQTIPVTPATSIHVMQSIPFDELASGLHSFSIRFKDENGQWSSVSSQIFRKNDLATVDRKMVAYEYWVNDEYDKRIIKEIDHEKTLILLDSLDVRFATKPSNAISYRFKDDTGLWSATVSSTFYHPAKAEFTHITGLENKVAFTTNSQYADAYLWDFGDGSASTQVHPEHIYAEPGVYQVKLIAQNGGSIDSISHNVEIEGIRAIHSNKGGNGGYVTVNIYGGGLGDAKKVILQKGAIKIIADTIILLQEDVLRVKFNLIGKEIGVYDVIVETTKGQLILENGFTIEEKIEPSIGVEIIGSPIFILGRPHEITIEVTNYGNVDVEDIPIIIMTEGYPIFEDNEGNVIEEPQPFIPFISAGGTVTIKYKIEASNNYTISVIPQANSNNRFDCFFALGIAGADILVEILDLEPVSNCAYAIVKSQIVTIKENIDNAWDPWTSHAWNWVKHTFDAAVDCGLGFSAKLSPSKWIKAAKTTKSLYGHGVNLYNIGNECFDAWDFSTDNPPFVATQINSFDPNEILGVSGFGEQNYIKKKSHLSYTIHFENHKDSATAPAQEIFLIDTLDLTKFNTEEFSFCSFTFRDTTIEAIPGVHEFSKDIDMRDKGEDIIIRVSATLDTLTGIARWYFIALDPITMDLTENPNLGILYPNTTPPIGEGNVTYRLGLLPEVGHGVVIENKASITFDLNEPVVTNTWKNTIDDRAPQSLLTGLKNPFDSLSASISFSAQDEGAGVRQIEVYVSGNSDSYMKYATINPDSIMSFHGNAATVYRFFSMAIDHVGNREPMKIEPEFTLSMSDAPTDINLSDNEFNENDAAGTWIGRFSTIDDYPELEFRYALVNGEGSNDNALFVIHGDTLFTNTTFDCTSKSAYTIRVRTTDFDNLWFEKSFSLQMKQTYQADTTDISEVICQGEVYNFFGVNLSTSGIYTHALQTVHGCDSIVVLTLTVGSFITTPISASICQGSSYHFGDEDLTLAGIYRDTLQTPSGCDSIVVLTLTVGSSITTPISASICQGSSYHFGDEDLTLAGIYRDTLQTPSGCDSIVVLTLTVNPKPEFVFANPAAIYTQQTVDITNLTLISGDTSGLVFSYLDHGFATLSISMASTISTSGVYYIVGTIPEGCSDTAQITVAIYDSYTIVTTASSGGSINPSGEITVPQGGGQIFTFTPDANYRIDQVLVDGVNVPEAVTNGSYTFENVIQNHNITVIFISETGVELSGCPENGTMHINTTLQLSATGGNNVTWRSSNANTAIVDANGLVTAKQSGIVNIIATSSNGTEAVCTIRVVVPVTGITLNKTNVTLAIGAAQQLIATVLPSNASIKTVTWSSSPSNIATVDATGKVTALATENVVIVAITDDGGFTATCNVTVVAENIRVTGVSVTPTAYTIGVNSEPFVLTATVRPANATNQNVTWSSSNNAAATVDDNGVVTPHATGKAVITVKTVDGSYAATSTITVVILVETITVTPDEYAIALRGSKALKATVLPANATNKTITWSSSDPSIATVNASGIVTAKNINGVVLISATNAQSGVSGICVVTVGSGAAPLAIDENETMELMVYPNPTTGELNIKNKSSEIKTIQVFDIAGRLLKKIDNINQTETTLSLSGFAKGVYFLHIDGKIVKVVKL